VFTIGQTAQAIPVPIKRELFMCEDIPILVGSLEVQEQPQAQTLMWPSLRRTHSYGNLSYNIKTYNMCMHCLGASSKNYDKAFPNGWKH